jgi:hypothetical protein
MLTGINFSPPLYFLFNFCIQLVFPTSIEQLRIQSLVFIIIGVILSFLLTRKIFGSTVTFFSTILVTSQSNLLLSQAQEARHYAMFFVCGAWVLYMQSLSEVSVRKYKWLTFLAHFCLCQVHYLGIIFSSFVGVSFLISKNEKPLIKRIPFHFIAAWILTLPVYLFLISQQSSHLGNWPKPNELSNLLDSYNNSLLILTILIPILAITLTMKSNKEVFGCLIKETNFSRTFLITSVLWFSVPLIFWVFSNLTTLNLFVDRYFIPKESALVILVAYGLSFIFQKLTQQKSNIPILCTLMVAITLLLVSTKRHIFGLNKNTNYHHSLIIENSYSTPKKPIILEGDPEYFPNAYLGRNECLFALENESLIGRYKRFSTKIKFVD